MKGVLLDTHAWPWWLLHDPQLSSIAVYSIQESDAVFVSPVSFFEIGQKVSLGKWPEMAPLLGNLLAIFTNQRTRVASLTPEVCLTAAVLEWKNRDPFDRLIAATALVLELTLMSCDPAFDTLDQRTPTVTRVW